MLNDWYMHIATRHSMLIDWDIFTMETVSTLVLAFLIGEPFLNVAPPLTNP